VKRARGGAGAWCACVAVVAVVAGCAVQTPPVASAVAPASSPSSSKGDPGKRVRLGWVAWADDKTLFACTRRVDDAGAPVGVLGPCAQYDDAGRHAILSWANTEAPDRTRSDASPLPGCRVALEDAQLAPEPKPARAWLVAPSGRVLLDAWQPEATLTADAYAVEPSFSPDGKLVAYVHVAVGLGEGERIVEVAGVKLAPAPSCK
jgi:hypothetical protein